jgi:hypothetical protein
MDRVSQTVQLSFLYFCSWAFLKAATTITAPELDKKSAHRTYTATEITRGTTKAILNSTCNAAESPWGSQGSDRGEIFPNLVASLELLNNPKLV